MLINIASGYQKGVLQWIEFLDSWNYEQQIRNDALFLVEGWRCPTIFELANTEISKFNQKADELNDELIKAEERLGVLLPNSYKDCILALGDDYLLKEVDTDKVITGLFHPSQIANLIESDPFIMQLLDDLGFPRNLQPGEVWEDDSTDSKYFVYGIEQDCIAARHSYWRQGIVIGMYGHSPGEKIVLYPDVKTADGEFETLLWFSSSEFRAITFAEVMWQLYISETRRMDSVPPYKQSLLKESAAKKIKLNIWWK